MLYIIFQQLNRIGFVWDRSIECGAVWCGMVWWKKGMKNAVRSCFRHFTYHRSASLAWFVVIVVDML